MIEVLLGLPAKVKTLVDRLTSTRATNLDNLDAAISTCAPGSTALSDAVWTDARAGKLDTAALEANPLLSAPIVSGLVPATPGHISTGASWWTSFSGLQQSGTVSTAYVDAVNYTGQGVLEFLAVHAATAGTATMKLTIDGVLAMTATSVNTERSTALVGVLGPSSIIALSAVPFKTSLRVEIKTSTAASSASSIVRYRKTA